MKSLPELLNIKPGEQQQVLLMLTTGFFMGTFIATYTVTAESLFLNQLSDQLDRAFLASGVFGIASTLLFSSLQNRIKFSTLTTSSILAIVFFTVGVYLLYNFGDPALHDEVLFTMYCLTGPMTAVLLLCYWGIFGRLFDFRQSKRIIGWIDTGQLIASILAFFLIPLTAALFTETSNYLIVCTISILVSAILFIVISYRFPLAKNNPREFEPTVRKETSFGRIFKDPYVMLLSIFSVVSMVTFIFNQFAFQDLINEQYPDQRELTNFLAYFNGGIYFLSLIMQTFVNDKIISNYGIKVSLYILPVIVGLFSIGALVTGIFFGHDIALTPNTFIFFFLFMALTATATKKVREDIVDKLALRNPGIYAKGYARENLSFVARKTENKEKQLLRVVQKVKGAAIVYVRSRRAAEKLSEWLTRNGVDATFYHAGLDYRQRNEHQRRWVEGEARVVVATNAFGMGIDKANVRTVVHMDIPETLEAYYQEAGRAGRDGKRSYAVVVYHPIDVKAVREKVGQSQPDAEVLKNTYQALSNYLQLAEGSAMGESFNFDLSAFCDRFGLKPITTFAALKKLEEQGFIQLNEGFHRPSKVHFLVGKKKLYEFQVANGHFDQLIKGLLRLYGGELFSSYVSVSEQQIGKAVGWNAAEARIGLGQLHKMQFLDYEPASGKPQVTFLTPRQDAGRLPLDTVRLGERRALALAKMEAMIEYVEQSHRCRTQFIQSYFDEEVFDTCGACDVCLEKKKKENRAQTKDYHDQVLLLLKQKPMTSEELEKAVGPTDQELLVEVIREMLDANEINYDEFWVLRAT